jgi:hypothetical protein
MKWSIDTGCVLRHAHLTFSLLTRHGACLARRRRFTVTRFPDDERAETRP